MFWLTTKNAFFFIFYNVLFGYPMLLLLLFAIYFFTKLVYKANFIKKRSRLADGLWLFFIALYLCVGIFNAVMFFQPIAFFSLKTAYVLFAVFIPFKISFIFGKIHGENLREINDTSPFFPNKKETRNLRYPHFFRHS